MAIFLGFACAAPAAAEGPLPGDGAHEAYYTEGPLRGSLKRDQPLPIYAPDPQDSWNRLSHLLFTRTIDAYVSPELETPIPAEHPLPVVSTVQRLEGGDIPDLFFADDVGYLLEQPRYQELMALLQSELEVPRAEPRSVEARLLFQQDLWNRFDALFAAQQEAGSWPLLTLIGRVIARIAPRHAELEGVRSNFADVAQAYPDLVDARLFSGESGWRELVSVFSGEATPTTMHARRARYRHVFRRFVRVPDAAGGSACLEALYSRNQDTRSLPCVQSSGPIGLVAGERALLIDNARGRVVGCGAGARAADHRH